MRILLTSNASYAPAKGGSTRSNLAWLRRLAGAGHTCRVVCPPAAGSAESAIEIGGIGILRVKDLTLHTARLQEETNNFKPDWVLVSSEDVSHQLLGEVHRSAAGRLVYLAHTPQFFPFGPESWSPDPRAAEIVRQARAVVAIGQHMAGYIRVHLGREAAVAHPPIYGEPPFRRFHNFGRGAVLMINPCKVKGIDIFVALAQGFPEVTFAALLGWGTTGQDRESLSRLRNVRLLENVPDIEEVLAETRVLVMPSLWYEGFGLIVMEAMLRGLPVIASDSGGLAEAKSGTGFVIPVAAITRYEPVYDETHMPRPIIPAQDITPWAEALRTLVSDQQAYEQEADRSRLAAELFVGGLRPNALEALLLGLDPPDAMAEARRALLERRLRERESR
jgi:glycosyltransferase involved in cell wall biosynthesis